VKAFTEAMTDMLIETIRTFTHIGYLSSAWCTCAYVRMHALVCVYVCNLKVP